MLSYPAQAGGPLGAGDLARQCGKLVVLDRVLVKLRAAGHRVLLFSTMTRLLDLLQVQLSLVHAPSPCASKLETCRRPRPITLPAPLPPPHLHARMPRVSWVHIFHSPYKAVPLHSLALVLFECFHRALTTRGPHGRGLPIEGSEAHSLLSYVDLLPLVMVGAASLRLF